MARKKKSKAKTSPVRSNKNSKEGGLDKLYRFCREFAAGVQKARTSNSWNSFGEAMEDLKKVHDEYRKEVRK